jgi:hypothetical protein
MFSFQPSAFSFQFFPASIETRELRGDTSKLMAEG